LFNFDPPVTDEEVRATALQFVRKISGFNKPSKRNEVAFLTAIDEVAAASRTLLSSPKRPRRREVRKRLPGAGTGCPKFCVSAERRLSKPIPGYLGSQLIFPVCYILKVSMHRLLQVRDYWRFLDEGK
jgi:hypothetical protein